MRKVRLYKYRYALPVTANTCPVRALNIKGDTGSLSSILK